MGLRHTHSHLTSLDYARYEFGVPHWYNTFWHRVEDDKVALSYGGHRVAEVLPDDSVRLLLHHSKVNVTAAVKKRWQALFDPFIQFESTKRVKSTGLYEHTVVANILGPWDTQTRRYPLETRLDATASNAVRIVFQADGTPLMTNDDVTHKTAEVDTAKQRLFNATLKKLRAVINGQISMGVFDSFQETDQRARKYYGSYHLTGRFRDAAREALEIPDKHPFWNQEQGDALYRLAQDWSIVGGPDVAKKFALVAFTRHTSNKDGNDDLKQRVVNAMKYVQTRYLQEHCVKIEVSNNPLRLSNDDSNDQNRELFPSDGLREVQVSGEAQVC